ncbi:MAG: hypothetical protein L3J88_10820 [Gammaproteobacteria bacterium]|nr:hypothetical protein [Gammaproteobacteria bacterium]MCF6363811.1 hypothetical protein [Gammaproteobacteria bacterium]
MTKHPRMIAAIALVTLATVALTGCLVEKKDPEPPNYRTTDNLRIYKQGDWIRYNVFATTIAGPSSGDFSNGTLEVRWGNYSTLTSPDGKNYDVIKKSYRYCLEGPFCNPTETVVIQYVHQDGLTTDTAGTERLVAMGGLPTPDQYYWLNTTGGSTTTPANPDNNIVGGQETVITLKSPLFINNTYTVKYHLMDGCVRGVAKCQSDVGRFTHIITVVGDGTQVNTNIGNYANPFRVEFSEGDVFPDASVNGQLPLTFDIFDLCSDGNSTHDGHMYIIPEIGVIQMSNTCTDKITTDKTRYDITIDSISSSILSGS